MRKLWFLLPAGLAVLAVKAWPAIAAVKALCSGCPPRPLCR